MLMEYLRDVGLESDPWEHQILYDVFKPDAREYPPTRSAEAEADYRSRFAARVFERLHVRVGGIDDAEHTAGLPADNAAGHAAAHAAEIWRLLGPASLALYPDVMPVLESLKGRGLPVAVVSNWQCGLARFCADLGIGGLVDHVIASAEVGWAKPEPEIFHEACGRLGTPPADTLHVGDSIVDDLEGARRAGLKAVLLRRGPDIERAMTPAGSSVPFIHGLGGILDLCEPEPA